MDKIIKVIEDSKRRRDAIQKFLAMEQSMGEELTRADEMLKSHPDAVSRRIYTRAVYAYVEGMIWLYKANLVSLSDEGAVTLTASEQDALTETENMVTDRGELRTQKAKISLDKNLRLVFKMYATHLEGTCVMVTDGEGYRTFKSGVAIRDRVTHPKSLEDLTVSEAEMTTVLSGWRWFKESIGCLTNALTNKYNNIMAAEAVPFQELTAKVKDVAEFIKSKSDQLPKELVDGLMANFKDLEGATEEIERNAKRTVSGEPPSEGAKAES